MKVLIACEESQVVTKAFRKKGHKAFSCDIEPCSGGKKKWHIQADIFEAISLNEWDMMIAFPPCTYLTLTGNRWFKPEYKDRFPDRLKHRQLAIGFFLMLYHCGIEKVAIENPAGVMSSYFRQPDQYIHPYEFGHKVSKKTGLWLKNLDPLTPGKIVEPEWEEWGKSRMSKWYYETSCLHHKERAKARSKTFKGIAKAMAEQWGLK